MNWRHVLVLVMVSMAVWGCASKPPQGDALSGAWSDGENTMEFLAPNSVVWLKETKTRRTYKKDDKMVVDNDWISKQAIYGVYRLEGDALTVAWVQVGDTKVGKKETIMKVSGLGTDEIQVSTEDGNWTQLGKPEPLTLNLKRENSSQVPPVGVWRNEEPGKFEGRILFSSGLIFDIGSQSPLTQMGSSRGGTVVVTRLYEPDEKGLTVKDLDWAEGDKTRHMGWKGSDDELSFFTKRSPLKMKRVKEPMRLDKNNCVIWSGK